MIEYVHKNYPIENLPLNTIVGDCPHCGRPLATRKGKYGTYIYCKNIDCHTNISIRKYALVNEDCINLINLKRAESNKDIYKANEIFDNCSRNVKMEAKWTIDRIYKKLCEESEDI